MKSFEERLLSTHNPLALQAVNAIFRRLQNTYGDEITGDLIQLRGAILRLVDISKKYGALEDRYHFYNITK